MIVKLKGINEEDRPNTNQTMWPAPPPHRAAVARLEGFDLFTYLAVPADMVQDAKIGDEFTVYLERVKK